MILFKRALLRLVLEGEKTTTMRTHTRWTVGRIYAVSDGYRPGAALVQVTGRRTVRLGDLTDADARKEGFATLSELRAWWAENMGAWNPEQTVTVYEIALTP